MARETQRDARQPPATYVFCLVQSRQTPSLRGVPSGLPGAGRPRLIPIEKDLWAVVADAPLDRFGPESLQSELQDIDAISRHALAHAAVVEFFFRRSPVIPLKLFTLFSSDARVQQDLGERGPKIRKLLKELRGLEEWGVRVVASGVVERSATSLRSGREYLETKKRLTNESASPSRATIRDAAAALKKLERLAAKVRKERFPPPGKGRAYVTGASFLVKTTRRGQWEKEIARLGAALADRGHRLDVSGPWPPYQFASR